MKTMHKDHRFNSFAGGRALADKRWQVSNADIITTPPDPGEGSCVTSSTVPAGHQQTRAVTDGTGHSAANLTLFGEAQGKQFKQRTVKLMMRQHSTRLAPVKSLVLHLKAHKVYQTRLGILPTKRKTPKEHHQGLCVRNGWWELDSAAGREVGVATNTEVSTNNPQQAASIYLRHGRSLQPAKFYLGKLLFSC